MALLRLLHKRHRWPMAFCQAHPRMCACAHTHTPPPQLERAPRTSDTHDLRRHSNAPTATCTAHNEIQPSLCGTAPYRHARVHTHTHTHTHTRRVRVCTPFLSATPSCASSTCTRRYTALARHPTGDPHGKQGIRRPGRVLFRRREPAQVQAHRGHRHQRHRRRKNCHRRPCRHRVTHPWSRP